MDNPTQCESADKENVDDGTAKISSHPNCIAAFPLDSNTENFLNLPMFNNMEAIWQTNLNVVTVEAKKRKEIFDGETAVEIKREGNNGPKNKPKGGKKQKNKGKKQKTEENAIKIKADDETATEIKKGDDTATEIKKDDETATEIKKDDETATEIKKDEETAVEIKKDGESVTEIKREDNNDPKNKPKGGKKQKKKERKSKIVGVFVCSGDSCKNVWKTRLQFVHREPPKCDICKSIVKNICKRVSVVDEICELDSYNCLTDGCNNFWKNIHCDEITEDFCEICKALVTKEPQPELCFGKHFFYKCYSEQCGIEWEDFYYEQKLCGKCGNTGFCASVKSSGMKDSRMRSLHVPSNPT